jgi:hypothetical protein
MLRLFGARCVSLRARSLAFSTTPNSTPPSRESTSESTPPSRESTSESHHKQHRRRTTTGYSFCKGLITSYGCVLATNLIVNSWAPEQEVLTSDARVVAYYASNYEITEVLYRDAVAGTLKLVAEKRNYNITMLMDYLAREDADKKGLLFQYVVSLGCLYPLLKPFLTCSLFRMCAGELPNDVITKLAEHVKEIESRQLPGETLWQKIWRCPLLLPPQNDTLKSDLAYLPLSSASIKPYFSFLPSMPPPTKAACGDLPEVFRFKYRLRKFSIKDPRTWPIFHCRWKSSIQSPF